MTKGGPPITAAAEPDLVGTLIDGRYRIEAMVARGGMGTVYKAHHEVLEAVVAVKVIHQTFATDQTYVDRFLREAKISSKIRHPNVVQTLDFGQLPNGAVYFVMEYLEGRTLSSLLKERSRLNWAASRYVAQQILRGLGAAHRAGVVHRDVKPSNILVIQDHEQPGGMLVKLVDFGVAKVIEALGEEPLTSSNMLVGTVTYMAPEQAQAGSVDARTDVYAVGVVLYRMLAGSLPFQGNSIFETLRQQVSQPPLPLTVVVPGTPPELDNLIRSALAKDPDDRFASMEAFEAALLDVWEASTGPPVDPVEIAATGEIMTYDELSITTPRPRPRVRLRLGGAAVVAATLVIAFVIVVVYAASGSPQPATVPAVLDPMPVPGDVEAEAKAPPAQEVTVAPLPPPHAAAAPDAAIEEPSAAAEDAPKATPSRRKAKAKRKKQNTTRAEEPTGAPAKPRSKSKSDGDVVAALKKRIRSRCRKSGRGTKVQVRFSVLSSGRVSVPRVRPPHDGSALGKCAANVVRGAKFAAGELRIKELAVRID